MAYPGFYPDVYPWIERCLQDNTPRTSDGYLDPDQFNDEIKSALRDSLPKAALATVGASDAGEFYSGLTGDDLDRVNEALGLIVSARMIGTLSTGGANGQLLSEKTELVSRTFANEPGNRAAWEARAAKLLRDCSFAPRTGFTSGDVIAANGPSRARDAARGRTGWGW